MNICFVSNEILGAHRNGGIGTATSNLAVLMATRGHQVTLFYTGRDLLDPTDDWTRIYHTHDIDVIHHPVDNEPVYPEWLREPTVIYEQLRGTDYDLIIFQDWRALGHSCVIAKKCGIAFARTILATIAHSSTPWLSFANGSYPNSEHLVALGFMEQQQVELSDAVVSPSVYLKNWMYNNRWLLPESTEVLPLFLGARDLVGDGSIPMGQPIKKPSHLIFFGRLEERKGIDVFLKALTSETLSHLNFDVSFLGKPLGNSIDEIKAALSARRPDLLARTNFYPNLSSDAAQTFIAVSSGIAIIPSLTDNSPCVVSECLRNKLPLVASNTGGIPELFHPDDRDTYLCEPTPRALAGKLFEVLTASEWLPARAAREASDLADKWVGWVERQCPRRAIAAVPAPFEPDITVVVTHYERPALLAQNLSALSMQTYKNFNVLIVDDGSTSQEAVSFLDALPPTLSGLSLKLIKQENRYLGAARNTGLSHVSTPYVILMDDDNLAFPTMIDVFRTAATSSGADIVTCQMQAFSDSTGEPDLELLLTGQRWGFAGGPIYHSAIRNIFGDATAIYKREVFERAGSFHEARGVTYEDWQLHLKAALAGCTLLSLPLPLFWYRVSPDSMYRTTNHYNNTEIIASTFRSHLKPEFAGLVDLALGFAKGDI